MTNPLRVTVENERVWIRQDLPPMDEQVIVLSPDQLVLVIEWLRDARDELSGKDRGTA